jgi:NhaP-type Na+/H+ and K+/H+ antiporter
MQGVVYYIYLLYCLASYRDKRELCFYCKYGMYVGAINVVLGIFWVSGGFPYGFVAFVVVIMSFVIAYRQAKKDVERD